MQATVSRLIDLLAHTKLITIHKQYANFRSMLLCFQHFPHYAHIEVRQLCQYIYSYASIMSKFSNRSLKKQTCLVNYWWTSKMPKKQIYFAFCFLGFFSFVCGHPPVAFHRPHGNPFFRILSSLNVIVTVTAVSWLSHNTVPLGLLGRNAAIYGA